MHVAPLLALGWRPDVVVLFAPVDLQDDDAPNAPAMDVDTTMNDAGGGSGESGESGESGGSGESGESGGSGSIVESLLVDPTPAFQRCVFLFCLPYL
jgi:uncharacterized membrane protein YgcG